ncbi:MAG TPA: FAD-binding protein [Ktedonosporobacter sp.]|jgi:fumarate reductase (CoM/CoB) subunit A|nr:FAD-binding protein [Ktedonosporobacter sp.]
MLPTEEETQNFETDVLVIGSGGAGTRAAIEAARSGARVILVTKRRLGQGGVTPVAVGAAAALGYADAADSPLEHLRDTVVGGHYLSNQEIVSTLAHEAPRRLLELQTFGARFDKQPDGRLRQLALPGHRYPRSVDYHMQTGQEIMRGLLQELHRQPDIRVIGDMIVCELLVDSGQIQGAVGLDLVSGAIVMIEARAVVLATGGIQEAYAPYAYHAPDLTGDGLALALRAGAELCDLEFLQFFPTALVWPPELAGLIWIGELRYHCGAWLMNKYGERFMARYDPLRMELATRDLVARGIATEMLEGRGTPHGGVWMSVAHLAQNQVQAFLDETFPDGLFGGHDLRAAGIDIRRDALEVAPIVHFHMGGIRIDALTRTRVAGLFAAGEVAAGVHGANRIENNALTEALVFGALAGEQAGRYARATSGGGLSPDHHMWLRAQKSLSSSVKDDERLSRVRAELQRILWERVGLVRDGDGLEQAITELVRLRKEIAAYPVPGSGRQMRAVQEVQNLVLVAEALARAAYARQESRGAHFRIDYPNQNDSQWLVNLIVTLEDGEFCLRTEPVQFPYVAPTARL